MKYFFLNIRAIRNDGQGGEGGGTPPPKTFTQEQVNEFLANERRKDEAKFKKQNEEVLSQLNSLRESKNLTDQEKADLESRIEQLTNQTLTEKQILENKIKKLAGDHDTTVKTLSSERDGWKSQYDSMLVNNALTQAAITAEAFSAEQILQVLGSRAKVLPVLDESAKPIPGQYKVVVPWADKDKQGNPVTLELTADEVLKRMKDDVGRFGNLFKSTAVGGTGTVGGSKTTTDKPIDVTKLNYKEHVALRKKGLI